MVSYSGLFIVVLSFFHSVKGRTHRVSTLSLLIISMWGLGLLVASAQEDRRWDEIVLTDFRVTEEGGTLSFGLRAPAVLQETMWAEGLTPHPFVGSNEDSIRWISDRNWLMEASFELPDDTPLSEMYGYRLSLPQVDTFAEIYLNGAYIGRTENLFRHYTFDVQGHLRPGTNRLVIRLLSPTRIAHAIYLSTGINYPADNDRNEIHYAPLVRKSQYHFGWDWGPRIVTMGLGAPVRLTPITAATIDGISVSGVIDWDEAGGGTPIARSADVTVRHELTLPGGMADIRVTLLSPEGQTMQSKKISASNAVVESSFSISTPELWMPAGWGAQPLYAIVSEVEGTAKADTTYFGLREVSLDMSRDSIGQAFTFVVNRRPLYVKGANYLPHDRRFGGGGRSLSELFEQDIVPAHFNMLRVWGGGDWETEEFYHLADRHGILIWQDLPFACSTYPNHREFRHNVSLEIRDQLSRIANHPSLALLCGNNEVLEGLKHWGWKKKYGYSDEVWAQMNRDYEEFFGEFIAHEVATYAPHVDYIHGSPVSSNWGNPESLLYGDSHYWGVWFGGEEFDTFERHHGRFASEYGFQAFPEMKTIQSFDPSIPTDTMSIMSPLLVKRQRSFIGNERIEEYMRRSYPVPTDFTDFVYVGQVLQGRGMGEAMRALRRSYPVNMGSLYWQFNDVWPTVSWSGIDYYGNYKALQYEVRRAYAPVIVDIVRGEGGKEICLVSDDPKGKGTLVVKADIQTYRGELIKSKSYTMEVTETPIVLRTPLEIEIPEGAFVHLTVWNDRNELVSERIHHPTRPKEVNLPTADIQTAVTVSRGSMSVILSCDVPVMDLFIETPWQGARYSDNYFDLLPGTSRSITIKHPDINPTNAHGAIIIHSMNEILNKYK